MRPAVSDCLALVLHDATEWASAEERFERTFNANPAPAVICRLDDLRYVKVNQGFLDLTGHARDDVLGRSVYEIDVLDQADRRDSRSSGSAKARRSRRWRPC